VIFSFLSPLKLKPIIAAYAPFADVRNFLVMTHFYILRGGWI
jgi:hypothetical protein